MTAGHEVWTLVFQPQPSSVPAVVRFRALLKRAIRDYGLRCIAARDFLPGDPPPGVYDVRSAAPPAADPGVGDRPAGAIVGPAEGGKELPCPSPPACGGENG